MAANVGRRRMLRPGSPAITTEAWKSWGAPPVGGDLWDWHDGRCGWCGTGRADRIVQDHCHMTGFTRGLLCGRCNTQEGRSFSNVWDPWRDGDHPAAAMRVAEVYRSPWGGGTDVSPQSALHYYSHAEREAWWVAETTRINAGGSFPNDAPWSVAARARRDLADAQMREMFARSPLFGGSR